MEQLKHMKETLINCVQSQMSHLDTVDTEELGDVIDMIKDLEEAIYYCTITKAMEGKEKEGGNQYHHYYTEYRDMDRPEGRMYYPDNGSSSHNSMASGNNSRSYMEWNYPMERDRREGRSPMSRRMYMEAKHTGRDKATQLRELEKYMQELSQDITEMIADASPEEKQYLEKKITALASKIGQMK